VPELPDATRTEVLDEARAFLERLAGIGAGSLAFGPLAAWLDLADTASAASEFEGSTAMDIRSLGIVRVDGDDAVVDVDASQPAEARLAGARDSFVEHRSLLGALVLERVDGRWLTTDYTVEGVSLSDRTHLGPLATVDAEGARLTVLAVQLRASATRYVVEVATPDTARVRRGLAAVVRRRSWNSPPCAPRGGTSSAARLSWRSLARR
jgi:hypothetical protein